MIIPSITRYGRLVRMKRSLNVPGSLSSALQTMYFSVAGMRRTSCHFASVGKPAPPSPRSSRGFQHGERAVEIAWSPPGAAQQPYFSAPGYGSEAQARARAHRRRFGQFVAAQRRAHQRLGLRQRYAAIDAVVEGKRRRGIAASQAGDVAHGDFFLAEAAEHPLDAVLQFAGSAQMARHVGADAHFGARRRRQMKMRVEAGHAVQAIQRHPKLRRESASSSAGGQIAVLALNRLEFVEDHRRSLMGSAEARPMQADRGGRGSFHIESSFHIAKPSRGVQRHRGLDLFSVRETGNGRRD